MRQTSFGPVTLFPNDSLAITHRLQVENRLDRVIGVVGIRWELVYAEPLTEEQRLLLEDTTVAAVGA